MKVLALDSSGLVASVAVVEDDQLLAEYTVNYKKTHSQTLLPMLAEIATMIDLDLSSIDAIAVAAGPGSFTGLRIGSATGKGLALALDKKMVAIPTVDALAYNLYDCASLVCPIMDARRQQVYTGIYEFNSHKLEILMQQTALSVRDLAIKLNELGKEKKKKIIFLGDGVPVYKELLGEVIEVPYDFAPPHLNKQRAGAVATLALDYIERDLLQDAADHHPDYLRPSQAEREREEKLKKKE